jgi:hypothetical protein
VSHPEDLANHDRDHLAPLQARAGVRAAGWPWESQGQAPARAGDGLRGVNTDGWDGSAFQRLGPPAHH